MYPFARIRTIALALNGPVVFVRTVLVYIALAYIALVGTMPAHTANAQSRACADLASLPLPGVHLTAAVPVEPAAEGVTVRHCKVSGVIEPEIGFELLLPDDWNGRFFMGGGGGFVGTIQNAALPSVNRGYATAGTDAGHQGHGLRAGWALDHPERQINFGHRAVHRTAETSKAIIQAYYGSDPQYNYFFGCSRGGGQALVEAQRYPGDFDGIVAGAPAFDWPGIAAEFLQNIQANFPDPEHRNTPVLPPETLAFLEAQVLEACDTLDGVEDGLLEDPRACTFDVASLPACPNDTPGPGCVTPAQRAAIERVYAPAVVAGEPVYPGQPFGGEGQPDGGWSTWITGVPGGLPIPGVQIPSLQWTFATEFYKYFVFADSTWDYTTYDFAGWEEDTRDVGTLLNATDPDLSAFKDRGGKLILWHGWSDPALPAPASIDYYKQVEAVDPDVRDHFRLFLMPGVLHCGDGPGPDQVDWFATIADWVEEGTAPDHIVAAKARPDGTVARTRPLCPYPQQAVYAGSGSIDDAAQFVCATP